MRVNHPESTCPGCGLGMPRRRALDEHGYYNASPERWSIYTEVLGAEYSNALLLGRVNQLTVDASAVRHAGGRHPDKSVDVHLVGLHLALVRGLRPPTIPARLQALAARLTAWPHFPPPQVGWSSTIFDVALAAGDVVAHETAVRAWASAVWEAWSDHHGAVAELVRRHLGGVEEAAGS